MSSVLAIFKSMFLKISFVTLRCAVSVEWYEQYKDCMDELTCSVPERNRLQRLLSPEMEYLSQVCSSL